MGRFSTVDNAQMTMGGNYLQPGNHLLQIKACKAGQTRKRVDFFVVEFTVYQSDRPDYRPGTPVSWMVTMDKDAAPNNLKAFGAVACGVQDNPEQITGDVIEYLASVQNPLAGRYIRAFAWNKPTGRGTPFTRVLWFSPDTGADAAESAAAQMGPEDDDPAPQPQYPAQPQPVPQAYHPQAPQPQYPAQPQPVPQAFPPGYPPGRR